jgi:transposase
MRTQGSAEELERRRREAVRLLESGLSAGEVARQLGVAERSVRHWRQLARERGDDALAAIPHPGKPSKLTTRQRNGLRIRLLNGARAGGFDSDLWTCRRVQQLIQRRYNVVYHVEALPYVLKSLGFTCQKPQLKAVERNDEAIASWVARDWPRIKKRHVGSEAG